MPCNANTDWGLDFDSEFRPRHGAGKKHHYLVSKLALAQAGADQGEGVWLAKYQDLACRFIQRLRRHGQWSHGAGALAPPNALDYQKTPEKKGPGRLSRTEKEQRDTRVIRSLCPPLLVLAESADLNVTQKETSSASVVNKLTS